MASRIHLSTLQTRPHNPADTNVPSFQSHCPKLVLASFACHDGHVWVTQIVYQLELPPLIMSTLQLALSPSKSVDPSTNN